MKHKKEAYQTSKLYRMDVNSLELDAQFDRIVSIEMFEHLRNYKLILNSLNNLLNH